MIPLTTGRLFKIVYNARIIPAVRMNKRTMFANTKGGKRAREYLACKDALSWKYKDARGPGTPFFFPPKTPIRVMIDIRAPNIFVWDVDNLMKTVTDAANKIIYDDDRYIVSATITKARAKEWSTIIIFEEYDEKE